MDTDAAKRQGNGRNKGVGRNRKNWASWGRDDDPKERPVVEEGAGLKKKRRKEVSGESPIKMEVRSTIEGEESMGRGVENVWNERRKGQRT